ncbi:SDR family NAD(P)-dependent oxidoreductase [Xanthomonas hortorum]|uniref:SDR family NAD(P)-dependent oxidoreductase n=1 Tax=Xanthomonas hortorum TaxID=56454 RepID=UPI003316186F
MKKTVLITGASSGFGLLLANNLHKQGFNVIGTSREPEKHQSKVPFKLLRLDIDDEARSNHLPRRCSKPSIAWMSWSTMPAIW